MRKKNKKAAAPAPDWQTGDFECHHQFQFTVPYQLLLLCRLMDITPRQLLIDFMDNLSCGSWKREGKEKAKERLVEYFLEQGYGRHRYPVTDITEIFRELDAIGLLFPKNAEPSFVEQHAQWRENYHAYWFGRWFNKFTGLHNRKGSRQILLSFTF